MLNENSKYNYKETKKAVKALVLAKGIDNIINADFNHLGELGYGSGNIHKAFSYFVHSEQAKKYR